MSTIYRAIRRRIDRIFGIRKSSAPYISGDSFRALSQHVYGDPGVTLDPPTVKKGDVVFVKADKVVDFMRDIHPHIVERYVVISHNSDAIIDASWIPFIEDPKIIHWFGQNAMIAHAKLTPVPIGLENLHWHVNGKVSLFEKVRSFRARAGVAAKNIRVLFAFSIRRNPAERQPAFDALSKNPYAEGIEKARGIHGKPSPREYLDVLDRYALVASPPGNGIDCHRTWEAMYVGTVPIVKRSPAMDYFSSLGLPLWVIDSWDQIPQDEVLLQAGYDAACKSTKAESPKALWMEYWIEKIEKARHEA